MRNLQKMRWTQFFEDFLYSDNLLIISLLQQIPPFCHSNATSNPLVFRFLFRCFFKAMNYTLLNISTEVHSLFLRCQVPFQKLHAENFSKLLSF